MNNIGHQISHPNKAIGNQSTNHAQNKQQAAPALKFGHATPTAAHSTNVGTKLNHIG